MKKFIFLLGVKCLALTYSIAGTGPHHVVTGHYMFFNVNGTVLSGSDEPVTPTITGTPTNMVVSYPYLLSSCCTTFASQIAGLLTVKIDVSAGVALGTYPLTITFNSNTTHVIQTTTWNIVVDTQPFAQPLPTSYAPDVPLTGLSQWQSNMTTFGAQWAAAPLGCPAFEGFVWYYDGTRNYYQIQDYTGDVKWKATALALDQCYVAYINTNNGNIPNWHIFSKGLSLAFTRDGQTASKSALVLLQGNGYSNFGNPRDTIDFLASREDSYGVETNIEYVNLGLGTPARYQDLVEILFGIFDQWFISANATFVQPFMVALGTEALIDYEAASSDPRVLPVVKAAADGLWNTHWDAGSSSFLYENQAGNPMDLTTSPAPDLNLLILPMYGWLYMKTGDVSYRTKGDTIFNAGVAGAFLGDGKHFSQNYRWSGQYVTKWRAPVAFQITPITPVFNNFSSTVLGVTFGSSNAAPHCYFWSQISPPYRVEVACYTDATTIDPIQATTSGNMTGSWHFSGGDVTWIITKNNVTGLLDYQFAAALTGQAQQKFTGSF